MKAIPSVNPFLLNQGCADSLLKGVDPPPVPVPMAGLAHGENSRGHIAHKILY